MNRRSFLFVVASAVVASVLVGCGGGGSHSSTPSSGADDLLLVVGNQLVIARPDGTTVRTLPPSLQPNALAVWSRDHRRIAFVSGQAFNTQVINVCDAQGANVQTITAPSAIYELGISPNGQRVLYTEGTFPYVLRERDLNTNTTRTLPTPGHGAYIASPVYAPDGRTIFFGVNGGDSAIDGVYKLDSSNTPQLVAAAAQVSTVDVSPDARSVLFCSTQLRTVNSSPGNPHIYLVSVDGQTGRSLTSGDTTEIAAVFSPDGNRIAFIGSGSNELQLFVAQADGTNPRQLSAFHDVRDLDWK